jgi:hypothetical protein
LPSRQRSPIFRHEDDAVPPLANEKSTLATALLERLVAEKFQLCIFDPEGDYGNFADTVTFGDATTPVSADSVLAAVQKLGTNVTANLLGSSIKDRPGVLAALLPPILNIRAKYGRPHWILVDEALDVLKSIGVVLIIGHDSLGLGANIISFEQTCRSGKAGRGPGVGEAIYWNCGTDDAPVLIRTEKPKGAVKRHTRKYAQGKLGDDRSFIFHGPEGRLNIRAYNLDTFLDIGEGVDAETYVFHFEMAILRPGCVHRSRTRNWRTKSPTSPRTRA